MPEQELEDGFEFEDTMNIRQQQTITTTTDSKPSLNGVIDEFQNAGVSGVFIPQSVNELPDFSHITMYEKNQFSSIKEGLKLKTISSTATATKVEEEKNEKEKEDLTKIPKKTDHQK